MRLIAISLALIMTIIIVARVFRRVSPFDNTYFWRVLCRKQEFYALAIFGPRASWTLEGVPQPMDL